MVKDWGPSSGHSQMRCGKGKSMLLRPRAASILAPMAMASGNTQALESLGQQANSHPQNSHLFHYVPLPQQCSRYTLPSQEAPQPISSPNLLVTRTPVYTSRFPVRDQIFDPGRGSRQVFTSGRFLNSSQVKRLVPLQVLLPGPGSLHFCFSGTPPSGAMPTSTGASL